MIFFFMKLQAIVNPDKTTVRILTFHQYALTSADINIREKRRYRQTCFLAIGVEGGPRGIGPRMAETEGRGR